MKWKTVEIITLVTCLLVSCSPREKIGVSEDPRLKHSFSGYYKTCEKIALSFGTNGRFACLLHSSEFVGHFYDVVWGTYSADSTHIYLQVDRCNEDNLKYNTLPVELADSILFTPSGDSLIICFEDSRPQQSVLIPGKPITSFPIEGNRDDTIAVIVIIGLTFLLVFVTPIVLVVLLCLMISKLIK